MKRPRRPLRRLAEGLVVVGIAGALCLTWCQADTVQVPPEDPANLARNMAQDQDVQDLRALLQLAMDTKVSSSKDLVGEIFPDHQLRTGGQVIIAKSGGSRVVTLDRPDIRFCAMVVRKNLLPEYEFDPNVWINGNRHSSLGVDETPCAYAQGSMLTVTWQVQGHPHPG